jgi:type VI protein secretion system component Hcp
VRSDVVETTLALQRSAGNQAVSGLVARAPTGDTKEKEGAKAGGPQATLPGIGTIPLLSVSFSPSRLGGTGGSGGREETEPAVRELVVTSRVGEHTPALLKAASDGKAMKVEIVIPGERTTRLTLTGAIVSSYQVSGRGQPEETETWTLNVQAIEHAAEEAEGAASGRETSSWSAPFPAAARGQ